MRARTQREHRHRAQQATLQPAFTILPIEGKKEFDIGLPTLSPSLIRKKSLAEEIAGLEVMG